jgi:hypothetical protein
MMNEIELSSLDLRYEGYRMRNRAREARLLGSIAERGIVESLEGVSFDVGPVLLNGFKRLRCARRLGLGTVPYVSLGEDAATGIVSLLRASNDRALTILEQAGFVDELKRLHGMSVAQIAEMLSRSKGWVGMRLGLLDEMSPVVRQTLFSGTFPVYAYMYSVRPFMRMNGAGREAVESLVLALSGKGLSVRQIAVLAHGYFHGSEELREQIRCGKVALPLVRLNRPSPPSADCTPCEQAMLKDIQIVRDAMGRVSARSADPQLQSSAFRAQAHLLLSGILDDAATFTSKLRELYDRCGHQQRDPGLAR